MEWERQRTYDFDAGKEAKAIEDAINCLNEGDSPEKVARCIGLPLEKVLELQKQIPVKAQKEILDEKKGPAKVFKKLQSGRRHDNGQELIEAAMS